MNTKTENLTEALRRLKAEGFRLTKTREKLLEVILRQTAPFSVPMVEKIFARQRGHFDSVTIYRSVPVLEKLGIIEKCGYSEGVAHYEVRLNKHGHHHHVVCTGCKKIEPLDHCIVKSQEVLLRKLGYTGLKHRLEFSGTCPSCSKMAN